MKRLLVLLVVLVLATGAAFAQFVPQSMQYGMTMGLFENEIDQAFQANANFGQQSNNFLFAGLGNPTAGMGTFAQVTAFNTAFAGPIKLGYYMAGSMPISLYTSATFAALANRSILGTTTTPTNNLVFVTTGTTTQSYNWVSQNVVDAATHIKLASTWQADIQGLTKLGPAVVGLYLAGNVDNSASDTGAADGYYNDITTTFNVNTAAAGVIPVTVQDYTTKESTNNVNPGALPGVGGNGVYAFVSTYQVGVPFAMKTGNIEHRASLDVSFGATDRSASYSLEQSAHAQTVGGAANNDVTIGLTSKTTTTDINLNYGLRIPAGAANNEWRAGAQVVATLNGQEYTYDSVTRPYDLSVLNAKTALAGGTHAVRTTTYAPGVDFNLGLSGGRVFAFEPAKGVAFRFEPTIGLGIISTSSGPQRTGYTNYANVLDAAGVYDNTTPYNTTSITVTGTAANTFIVAGTGALPMGVTVKPADWPFGLLLGASPSAMAAYVANTSSAESTTTSVVNKTGTTVNTTGNTTVANTPNTVGSMFYSFTEVHYVGITVPFEGGAHFDARLNGNLFDFESFTIQAIIPFK